MKGKSRLVRREEMQNEGREQGVETRRCCGSQVMLWSAPGGGVSRQSKQGAFGVLGEVVLAAEQCRLNANTPPFLGEASR